MIFRVLMVCCALLFSGEARAASLNVRLTTPDGAPIRDAVVTVHAARAPSGAIRFSWPMRIAQRDMHFDPFVLIAPAGAEVAFPNFDSVRHHVYSFSPPGPFELRLYGRDETRSVRFDNVGVVAVGCNIHDAMSAFVYVVDTPYAAKTDARGAATIADLPAGVATARVWHPYLRAPENRLERAIRLTADAEASEAFEGQLRRPAARHHSY